MTLALRFAARSHTGLLREGNEDSVYAGPRVLAVADGMGGHAAGEVASAVAIAALAPLDEDVPSSDLLDVLRDRAVAANAHLRDMVTGDHALEGMGTTLTAFLFAGSRLGMLHIGDSRAYLLRDGTLTQITHDHTLVQALVDDGRISEEEASTHPQRSLITRALDGREGIEPDLSVREVRAGDRYLLCTDGLTGPVARAETLQEALEIPDPQEACDRLVQLALRGGGPDNVTVIVADVVDAQGLRPSPAVVAGAAADRPQPPPDGIAGSSAARARAAEGRDAPDAPRAPAEQVTPGPSRRRRTVLASLLALVLLVAAAGAGWAYVRSQYYVGVADERVTVFRGVTGSLAGISFSSVSQRTALDLERLNRMDRSRVERGIVARDRSHAQRIVARLDDLYPECTPADEVPDGQPTPAPSPTAAPAQRSASEPVSLCPAGPRDRADRFPVVRPRRGTELGLTVFAVLVAVLAYTAVGLAVEERVPSGTLGYGLGLGGLFLLAHLVVRYAAPHADPLLLPCVALLNGLGLVVIRRLDFAAAERAAQLGRDLPSGEAPRQLVWTAVGVLAFATVLLVVRDHTRLQRYTYTAAVSGLVLLLLPALPVLGRTINGARLWIRVGPFTLQPSEVAKLLLIVFFAGYLVAKRDVLSLASRRVLGLDLPRARDLGPVLLAWAASLAVLVRGRDLGSSLLFFALFVVMLYVATERTSWLVIGVGLFLGGAYVAYTLFSHVQRRVDIWLDPFEDPDGAGFQLVQSLFGFGTGGLTGTGLGEGRPGTVPFASTDFIMAAIGEELGLVGVMAVLLVFGLVVERGLRAALSVRDSFGKLLAAGLSFSLALQVFVIVGGVTGLIPLTGVTLPWLSYGGSSIVANWVLVALLLRVSDAGRQPVPAPVTPDLARAALASAETQVVRRPGRDAALQEES